MSEPAVRYELSGPVATLTLARPESRNALSAELVDSLADALATSLAEPSCRVVVLTNEGNTFCAGADLRTGTASGRLGLGELLSLLLDSPKPVVGRVAGHCMGGGVGLAAACDISVMASDCLLGFTEVRLGVVPAVISVVCLPKLRAGDARELFLTGERLQADRAAELGIVNRSIARSELDSEVDSVVSALLRGGPTALGEAKKLLATVPTLRRDEAFELTTAISDELFKSEEAREGMAAFRERRQPSWAPHQEDR